MPGDEAGGGATRREFLLSAGVLLAGAGGLSAAPAVKREGRRAWLTGLPPYGVLEPMFEALRLALVARGAPFTAAYVQGVSGAAFRLAGICPCAPTCNLAMGHLDLLHRLGYEASVLPLNGQGEGQAQQYQQALAYLHREIDAGRPVPVWNAFSTAEWDLVCGYDDDGEQLVGYGSSAGRPDQPQAKPAKRILDGDICPPLGVVQIGQRLTDVDAPALELAALREAVRHARSQSNVAKAEGPEWVMLDGLACYDRWIRSFGQPNRKLSLGDRYCSGIYSSTHSLAPAFLREIAPRHAAAQAHLLRAADAFQTEAEHLRRARPWLGWQAKELDAARDAQVAPVLQAAREAYAAGMAELEAAVA